MALNNSIEVKTIDGDYILPGIHISYTIISKIKKSFLDSYYKYYY